MKNEREIRWLQLSDLHMFDSTEVVRQKKQLYSQFKGKIDFVIITGDLHQYNTDYSLSKSFLEELVQEMELDKKDIIIIPGNHDAGTAKGRKEAIEDIDKTIETDPDIYRKHLSVLKSSFGKFKRFLEDFYEKEIESNNLLDNHLYVWENSIAIICLNTALCSNEDHNRPQILDIYGLEQIKNRIIPCIAVMHHEYFAISDMQKPFIKAQFKELGVSAALSGHKHRYSANSIDLGNGESIPNYCCAKSISEPGDLWSDIGLIEYRWKIEEKDVKVIPYEWERQSLRFNPSAKLESQGNLTVDDKGNIKLKKSFIIREAEKSITFSQSEKKNVKSVTESKKFDDFFINVQKKYLDGILEYIKDDEEKFKCAIEIMRKIIQYKGKKIEFDKILNLIITCKEKLVLSINGLQGTGKSTFMSLLYYKIKMNAESANLFPVLIDLHYFENYTKANAKKILNDHLEEIDNLIKNYPEMKFLIMFDGADEYFRKTTELEDRLYDFVHSHNEGNFAFCIGSAEKLPNEMIKNGKLQNISRKAVYRVEAQRIKKSNSKDVTFIIKNLCTIYGFHVEDSKIQDIKRVINIYTINEIDYRTLLIILRIFDVIPIKNNELQLGNYFYEYYMSEMAWDENELIKHAKAAYNYTVSKKRNISSKLKYAKIIYNNGITRDFLVAYYFVYLIRNKTNDMKEVLNGSFVFTASVNKFIKDLILNKYENEQNMMVEKLIYAYEISNISMKSQICYILGRIRENNAKMYARSFLNENWNKLYGELFENNILIAQNKDIKSKLVLFRTISVSLIFLNEFTNQENFIKCIILNEKLNQINRGFHLEYYEDKAYINGESPSYVDDDGISVEKTMRHLINNINKGFSGEGKFNRSVDLDIITLYSIYQYRMDKKEITDNYKTKLLDLADKILKCSKIQSETIIHYVTTIKELLTENPYKTVINEIYQVKHVKREGWVRRGVNLPESIADHMYACFVLGMFFLPNRIEHCIDYEIADKENYKDYSKDKILQMLLLHDLAEADIGDIVTWEKSQKDSENESNRFNYYEFLCSFPKIYGLGNRKAIWDEFEGKTTINARIANDLDKIEPVIQANIYKNEGNKINIHEWIDYANQNVQTSLGKRLLDFIINTILG